MKSQRSMVKWFAMTMAFVMLFESALILPSASAQGENTPTPTDCNAGPCSVTSSPSTSTHSLQSFTGTGSVTGITDPTLIANPSVYDFSADEPYSAPTSFPGGTFSGDRQVRVVGPSWGTWNPQIDGKHVLFAPSSTVDILFASPQMGIVVKAQPNIYDWFNITIEAFDSSGVSLGSFTQSINGDAGASFLGVLSTSDNIAKITLSSDPAAAGFAFSDMTYGSSVALSCSGTTLSPVAQTILEKVDPQMMYCGNNYEGLITLPSGDPPSGQDAFVRFSELAKTARYEVDFTTMIWDQDEVDDPPVIDSPGELFLQGVKDLYEQVKDPLGHQKPADYYADGVHVKILVGVEKYPVPPFSPDQRIDVLADLYRLEIPRTDPAVNWTVSVGSYYGNLIGFGEHSHVKMMIVDGEHVIAGGYNVDDDFVSDTPHHDMGFEVRGPIAQNSLDVFDGLWMGAHVCSNEGDNLDCSQEATISTISHHLAVLDFSATGNDVVFSLFRNTNDKTADNAIAAAIEAASSEVNIIQSRFVNFSFWDPPQYAEAILNVLDEEGVVSINLIVSSGSGGALITDAITSAIGICNLYDQIWARNPLNILSFKARFSDFSDPLHTKALSIDDSFTIVGSQNFDMSAWGNTFALPFDYDLAEYNLAIDSPVGTTNTAATDFNTKFLEEWEDANAFVSVLCATATIEDGIADSIAEADPGSIVFIPPGVYTESITINKPLVLVSAGANETILHPEGNQPAFRITSSDVVISNMKISGSDGYGVELIDSSPSSLKDIQINRVVFENNAQGGVLAQGLIPGSPMNYTIENSTFIGGADGVTINMIGTQADTSFIRNTIFSGQTNAPIRVLSATDSHVEYSYNLFDDCGLGSCATNWRQGNMSASSSTHDNLFDLSPLFASPENGAYQLSTGSPAIDSGDPSLLHDFFYDGDNDGTIQIDIGAFEYVPVANVAPVVNAGNNQTVELGNSVTVNATYSDTDNSENHSARIDWGDGIIEDVPVNMTGPGAGEVTGQHTYANPGNYTVEICVTDIYGGVGCDTINVEVISTPIYLSLNNVGTVGGVSAQDVDILSFNGTTWSMFFDGSDVGISTTNQDLNEFHLLDADTILMTFDEPITLGTLAVDPWDVVRFDATSLGNNTAGTFSMYLDGNDVGLNTTSEYLDGLHVLPDGRVLISTTGSPSVSGVTGAADEDILAFTPTALGDVTSGTWSMYFEGSDVGLADSSAEDVDALAVRSNGDIYLSTAGNFAVTGISGLDEDVFICAPTSLGAVTACNYSTSLYFDGSAYGLDANDVDGIHLTLP